MKNGEFRKILREIRDDQIKTLTIEEELTQSQINDLCDVLKTNQSLTTLNMGNTILDPEGAKAIAAVLKENKFIRNLDFGHSYTGHYGTISLASALAQNKSLIKINLANSILWPRDFEHIQDALNIPGNRIYETGINDINETLKYKKEKFLVAANKLLSSHYIEIDTLGNLSDDAKIALLFENLDSIKCSYQIMWYFQSKDTLNASKLDSTILPSEILSNILSFMYPTLAKRNGINKSWQMANKKIADMLQQEQREIMTV